jgi:AcrR family transcriptional regulator
VACELFDREGFAKVTLDDLASAAGVSRSTFLRYFGSKEDAVLSVVDVDGEKVAGAIRARPAGEDDWTALRRAMDAVIELYHQDPAKALAVARLVGDNPSVCGGRLEKQRSWLPAMAQALAERADPPKPVTLPVTVRAAAALDCLNVAVDHWAAADGRLDLVELLDQAFAALAPG